MGQDYSWDCVEHTEDRLPSPTAPPFIMGRDCLWNSEDINVGHLSPSVSGALHKDKLKKGLSMAGYLILCSTCWSQGTWGPTSVSNMSPKLLSCTAFSFCSSSSFQSWFKQCLINSMKLGNFHLLLFLLRCHCTFWFIDISTVAFSFNNPSNFILIPNLSQFFLQT